MSKNSEKIQKDLEWVTENLPIGRKVFVKNTKTKGKVMTEPRVLTNRETKESKVCLWVTGHNEWFAVRDLAKLA
ncbi:MAG: hypothetical protein VKK42_21805 [Lyngbya sp.]|nr:hypothetical protein [Lyngbya sp.]